METPETRYTKTPDGVSIADQVVGDGPLDLAYMTGWSHLEFRWESPHNAHFLERLASFSRLIIFDRRRTGQSDPLPTERGLSWEDWMGDLEFVLDEVESKHTALVAFGEGGCMATLFAATDPERTTALALMNFAPRYLQAEGYP